MSGNVKSTLSVDEFSQSIGHTLPDTPTFDPLMDLSSEWMCFAADFHVNRSLVPASNSDKKMNDGYGLTSPDSFAFYDRDTHSLRTHQVCLTGDLATFSGTWPKCGLMRNGTLYPLHPSEHPIFENEFGLLPTPIANDGEKRGNYNAFDKRNGLGAALKRRLIPTPTASDHKGASAGCRKIKDGELSMLRYFLFSQQEIQSGTFYPHPRFVEGMMGYPIGHTELELSETPSSLKSPNGSDAESLSAKTDEEFEVLGVCWFCDAGEGEPCDVDCGRLKALSEEDAED